MKFLLSAAFAALFVGVTGVHAETSAQTPAEVAAFLESATHCSVLTGGADRAGDGADRAYAEALNRALNAIGGSLPAAVEAMRSVCESRSLQAISLSNAAP